MFNWIKDRGMERTSWDGGALIAVGVVVLFLGPFAKYAAMAAYFANGPRNNTTRPTAISAPPSHEVRSITRFLIQLNIIFSPLVV